MKTSSLDVLFQAWKSLCRRDNASTHGTTFSGGTGWYFRRVDVTGTDKKPNYKGDGRLNGISGAFIDFQSLKLESMNSLSSQEHCLEILSIQTIPRHRRFCLYFWNISYKCILNSTPKSFHKYLRDGFSGLNKFMHKVLASQWHISHHVNR